MDRLSTNRFKLFGTARTTRTDGSARIARQRLQRDLHQHRTTMGISTRSDTHPTPLHASGCATRDDRYGDLLQTLLAEGCRS